MTNKLTFKEQMEALRIEFPNDKEFGNKVASLLLSDKTFCCLCDEQIPMNPLTKWDKGNNPSPLGKEGDRCCDDCNASVVVPTRMGDIMGNGIINALK